LNDAPVILSVSPAKAKVGEEIEISGNYFTDTKGTVEFNSTPATAISSWTKTKIKVTVPQGALTGNIIVKVNSKASKGYAFEVIEPEPPKNPVITSLNPASAYEDEEISVNGSNFGDTQGTSAVYFNNVKATAYTSWSSSLIKVKVPSPAITGQVKVVVGTLESNTINFTKLEIQAPSITSLSKAAFKVGDEITITGQNFGDKSAGNGKVLFNGIAATGYGVWSTTSIKVTVPQTAVSGKLTVEVYGKISNAVDYTIESAGPTPAITSLSIDKSPVGEKIFINGTNFGNSAGINSYVTFGSYKATTTQWSPTQIQAVIPDMPVGPIKIWVYANGVMSNGFDFTVMAKAVIIVEMVEIPAGNFLMGHPDPLKDDAYPQHKVTFTKPLLVAKTEINQSQYKKVMNQLNPSRYVDNDNPVEQLTFMAACDFCNRLSKLEGYTECYTINGNNVTWNKSANGYRLLTEAEWEYACRAGSTGSNGKSGGAEAAINEIAWNADNANGIKHVGLLKPNDFGLYDMQGNAAEWVWDFYDYYEDADATDPTGPASSAERCFRGGGFIDSPAGCSTFKRYSVSPLQVQFYIGFRVCRTK
jgi:formylglycine-generating enzyme required for sulfatase activity